MTTDEQFEKAKAILATAKKIDKSLPRGDDPDLPLIVEIWAGAIFAHADYSIDELRSALVVVASSPIGDGITPNSIVVACRRARADRLDRETPEERDQRAFERDRRLGLDTSWFQPDKEIHARKFSEIVGGFGAIPD